MIEEDIAWDNEEGEYSEMGVPIQIDHPNFQQNYDVEMFIMSLPADEARVLIARALGFEGRGAAELAGFKSVWIYIRKLRKLQARAQTSIGLAI